jgi:hypothetical protein
MSLELPLRSNRCKTAIAHSAPGWLLNPISDLSASISALTASLEKRSTLESAEICQWTLAALSTTLKAATARKTIRLVF